MGLLHYMGLFPRTQSKAGWLHAGIFYETECLENYGAHLLVVMADVYNIYIRLRLSDMIMQKECFSISLSSTIISSVITHLLVTVLICKIIFLSYIVFDNHFRAT